MAGPSFEQAQTGIDRMAGRMQSLHKEAEGFADSLISAFKSILPIGYAIDKIVLRGTGISEGFRAGFDALGKTKDMLITERRELQANLAYRLKEGQITQAVYDQHVKALHNQRLIFRDQLRLSEAIRTTGRGALAAGELMLGFMLKTVHLQHELNQSLIEANSSAEHRLGLLYDTLAVMRETGASFVTATNISRALVRVGFETEKNYQQVANTIDMMHEGLGASIEASVELAVVAQRLLKGNFQQVADVVASLVNSTSLAADEAARLGTNLGKAIALLRPGVGAGVMPDILKLVGQYEASLKDLGGQVGQVEQFLTKLSTPEGIAGAGALGVMSPEFLATAQGVEGVMQNFEKLGNQLVGQTQGWERTMRLQALGDMFGMSAEQANMLLMAVQRRTEQQYKEITLEERFKQQMNATNESLTRLGNKLMSLIHGGLYPFVFAVSSVANAMSNLIGWVLKIKPVAYAVMGALAIGAVALVTQLWGVVRAFGAVIMSSRLAMQVEMQLAATRAASAGVSRAAGAAGAAGSTGILQSILGNMRTSFAGGAASRTAFLASLRSMGMTIVNGLRTVLITGFSALLSPIGILVAAVAAIGGVVYLFYRSAKKAAEEERAAQQKAVVVGQKLFDTQKMIYAAGIRQGGPEGILEARRALASMDKSWRNIIPNWEKLSKGEQERAKFQKLKEMKEAGELAKVTRRSLYAEGGESEFEKRSDTVDQVQVEMRDLEKKQWQLALETQAAEFRAQQAREEESRRMMLRTPRLMPMGF